MYKSPIRQRKNQDLVNFIEMYYLLNMLKQNMLKLLKKLILIRVFFLI